MAQDTLVFKLSAAEARRLSSALAGEPFEARSVPHARFSLRGVGVVATLYDSGKLVVQGAGAEAFALCYVEGKAVSVGSKATGGAADVVRDPGPLVGGDESGKGDYFGPLTVAAVRLEEGDAAKLKQGGIADSKRISDGAIHRMAPALRETFPHAIRVLDPPEYNRRHKETGNVAILLSQLYREVVEEVARPGDAVLIDQFSKKESRLVAAMEGLDIQLSQRHHAEDAMAVAAASVLAREAFLVGLQALGEASGIDLPKGAGPPTLSAGRRFLQLRGEDRLGDVAKLHFKTTMRLVGGHGGG